MFFLIFVDVHVDILQVVVVVIPVRVPVRRVALAARRRLPLAGLLARSPRHLVLLLQTPARVGEPRGHLRQGHLGKDG